MIPRATCSRKRAYVNGSDLHGALIAACLVLARRFRGDMGWRGRAPHSLATGILVAAFFIAAFFPPSPEAGYPTGRLQRISITMGSGWVALLALRLTPMGAPAAR